MAYVVAANQGASAKHYPPFSWPGGSMVVDYDGRILAQADPGPGEKIVVAPVDVAALRAERERRAGHHMLAHRRPEVYRHATRPAYPAGGSASGPLTVAGNDAATARAKSRLPRPGRE
jgi:predicted amidohydrolase